MPGLVTSCKCVSGGVAEHFVIGSQQRSHRVLVQQGVLIHMNRPILLDTLSGFWIMQPSAGCAYQIVMGSRSRNDHVAASRLDWVECFVGAVGLQCALGAAVRAMRWKWLRADGLVPRTVWLEKRPLPELA